MSVNASQQPISQDDTITLLASCFALVRPVSMDTAAADEWLMVAAGEIAGYKRWMVESAAASARRGCSHHGQIIPHMIKHMEGLVSWRPPAELHAERQIAIGQGRQQIEAQPAVLKLVQQAAEKLRA